jgi:glycosyltransferase involved in cell wall biosynthesis
MKVLHVISSIDLRAGGPATALAGLSMAQLHAGLDVRVVSTFGANEKTDLADRLASEGIKTCVVGPAAPPLGRHPDLYSTLADAIGDCDIVHIHAVWEEIQHQTACIARALGRPYIFRPCGMLDPWSLRQGKWKKKMYMALRLRKDLNGAAALHFTTQTESDLVKPLKLSPPSIIEPNGVHLDEFDVQPARGLFRSSYPEIGNAPLIVFLGRVHHKKGLDLLVPAFARLPQKDARLVIAGPDNDGYGDQIRRMLSEHGVSDRVVFTGMLYGRDRIALLADADLFCLPSYQENFGLVVAEAMAAGCPVVISDQVNIHDDVIAAQAGGVVPCAIEPLADELNRWMSDPARRSAAGQRGRAAAFAKYDAGRLASRWAEHYANLIRPSAVKVLHVISNVDARAGGSTMALFGLAAAQRQAGLDVSIASSFGKDVDTSLTHQLTDAGIKVNLIGPVHGMLGNHPDIKRTLRGAMANVDVVHIHALWEEIQYQAGRLARSLGKPYIISPHGMLDPWSLRQRRWKKKLYLALRMRRILYGAIAIHFTTQTEADLVFNHLMKTPAIVEPNGLSLAEFENLPPRGAFRERYPQLADRPLLIFLGRIHYKKGFDLLIPAFARLLQKDAWLVIAGPDADGYTAQIRAMAKQHGVIDRIIFTGMLHGADRVAALADADLFCLPSYQENFGIAVAESLAAGTPVVISDQVNICNEVQAAGVGGVVPCKVEPLTEELNRWLSDAELRSRAAAAARPFVWQRYDWKQIAQRWVEHYKTLTAER